MRSGKVLHKKKKMFNHSSDNFKNLCGYLFEKFWLSVEARSGKVKIECRSRAVLEAASLPSVA
jgi:hypothetical protein